MTRRMNGPTKAARNLVAFLVAAGDEGFEVRCRTYGPHHRSVSADIVLAEGVSSPQHAGSITLYIEGVYAGDESMTRASGVGIALALRAGLLSDERARAFTTCGFAGNELTAQRAWLDRARLERERRAAYAAWMDAGCPDTFEAYQAKQVQP